MFGGKPQQWRDRPIPNVISMRRQAEKTAARLQHPVDAGQHCLLVEHMLESADADRQVDRLVGDSLQLLGVIHLERKIGSPGQALKTSACHFDHPRGNVNAYATSDFRCKGEEVMAVTATEVQDDISGPGLRQASHQRETVLEQPLRVTVLLRRAR